VGPVFTAADLPQIAPVRVVTQAIGAKSPAWPPLATDKVRYVGEAIAACVAPTRAEAEDLAASVTVDYEVLDAVVDPLRNMRGSPVLVHEHWGDNLYLERTIEGGDVEGAARAAEITVTRRYRMNRQSGAPLEGRAVLAYRDHRLDEVVIYTSTQTPHIVRVAIAENLGIDERCIRVVAPDVGGGFGPKARLYPEEIILAALALKLDSPVRWVEDRTEHLLASAHSRDHHYQVTAYADRHGKILGVDAEIIVDAGAYGMWPRGPYSETTWQQGACRGRTRSRITGPAAARWRPTRHRSDPTAESAAPAHALPSSGPLTRSRARLGATRLRYAQKT
jgi:carbon-monoxide dehydrogenase large subunit